MRSARVGPFFVYSGLILYGLFTLFPLIWMIITSMKSGRFLFRLPPSFVPDLVIAGTPWTNYLTVIQHDGFLQAFVNSVLVSISAAIGQVITCTFAGFVFSRTALPGRQWIFMLLLATMFFPTEITLIPEFLLFKHLGWLDSLLPLIVPSFFVGAFGTLMLTEVFRGTPHELEEAAFLEGASAWQMIRHLHIPLAMPAISSLFIVAFINNWDEVLRPLIFNSSVDVKTLPQFLLDFVGQYDAEWHTLLAGSVMSTLPLVLIYVGAQRWVVQGFTRVGIR